MTSFFIALCITIDTHTHTHILKREPTLEGERGGIDLQIIQTAHTDTAVKASQKTEETEVSWASQIFSESPQLKRDWTQDQAET